VSEAILTKVRKLLAKAEDPACTPAEAESFTAKATELIAKYGVDRALLAAADPTTDSIGDLVVEVPAPYALDKAGLLAGVAGALRCRSVRRRADGGFTMHLFGFDSDLERVELLYTSLLVQAARAMFAPGDGARRSTAAGTRAYRQSFLVAFASRIGERLRQAVEAVTDAYADRHATLLPVLADRRAAAEAACDETFPRVRPMTVSARDGAGWSAGQEAADAAQLDLHRPVPSRATA
jgi:hypothetical protein